MMSLEELKALDKEFRSLDNCSGVSDLLKDKRYREAQKSVSQQSLEFRQIFNSLRDFLKQFKSEAEQIFRNQHPDLVTSEFDVTAPFGINQDGLPVLPAAEGGSIHPIMKTQEELVAIFNSMGFRAVESPQLDSQFYMFDSLNFPPEHPARDEYDTFLLKEVDQKGQSLVAPAHTSTMQSRVLRQGISSLAQEQAIAVVIPGRVFRNEDVDASHDHMFYQLEGVYVDYGVNVIHLIATLQAAMSAYFKKDLEFKIQPFYFPFTEPSFELAISCPFCDQAQTGCSVCGAGWIELLGCGMIHPNVLQLAGIDAVKYTGFAWGLGLNRLAMINYGIEDVRHFTSGHLDFLRQFRYES